MSDTLPAPRAVLMDLDGVLVDSEPAHAAAWSALFAEHGVAFDLEDYRREAAGRARAEVIRAVLGEPPAVEQAALMARKVALVTAWITENGLRPVPGALSFVARARARGLPVVVVTSSRTPGLLLRGAGIDPDAFDAVIDGRQAARGKPDPALYRLGAEAAGVPAAGCWVVEDAPAGVASGKAAGCTVIALARTHPAGVLGAADRVVATFAEIPWPEPSSEPAGSDPG